MRRLRCTHALAALLLLLGTPGPARSSPLPFRGTLSFALPSLFVFAIAEGSGVAEVNGAGTGGPLTSFVLPAGAFATTASFPGAFPIGEVRVGAQNGPGVFAFTAKGGGGTMPLVGSARLCFLAGCDAATLFLMLPLGVVGVGGTSSQMGLFSVTLEGAPWTKGNVTISTPGAVTFLSGFAAGPGGLAGSTAQPGGRLLLVTPVRIRTSLPGFAEIPAFGVLDIHFVPEPSASLLLALGLAALAAGRRRIRAG